MANVQMPRLSDSMETGKILRWLKKEGEEVKKGEPLVEIESDKANIEVEAYASGKLSKIVVPEGESAPIGAVIAEIGGDAGAAPKAEKTAEPKEKAEKPAEPQGQAPAAATRPEAHVESAAQGGQRQPATAPTAAPAREERQATPRPKEEVEVVELSKMQTTIAMRLAQSKFSAPHFYVTSEIAMDDAARLRQMFNEAVDKAEAISLNDLIVKAVALALTKFPEVNASWADGRIERKRDINIGIAVGLPDRLIVPVLRNADQKSLKEIAKESKALIERARANKAGAQDYLGNTFSISNLGMYDVDQFTAIINPPDSGILAIGAIEDKAVVKDGQVVPGKRMRVTLSVDHRVFYGVTAAQFLQEVKRLLQSPMALVL